MGNPHHLSSLAKVALSTFGSSRRAVHPFDGVGLMPTQKPVVASRCYHTCTRVEGYSIDRRDAVGNNFFFSPSRYHFTRLDLRLRTISSCTLMPYFSIKARNDTSRIFKQRPSCPYFNEFHWTRTLDHAVVHDHDCFYVLSLVAFSGRKNNIQKSTLPSFQLIVAYGFPARYFPLKQFALPFFSVTYCALLFSFSVVIPPSTILATVHKATQLNLT